MGLALATEHDPSTQQAQRPDLVTELREQVATTLSAARARRSDLRTATIALALNIIALWGSTAWLVFVAEGWIAVTAGVIVTGLTLAHSIMRVHGCFHRRDWGPAWLWNSVVSLLHPFLLRDWWRAKHHESHHGATNVEGLDDDLATSRLLRIAPGAPWRTWQRYQHWYVFLLAPFLLLSMAGKSSWFALTGRVGTLPDSVRPSRRHAARMLVDQWWQVALVAGVACLRHPVLNVIGAGASAAAIAGIVLLLVFSVQHTTVITVFPPADVPLTSYQRQVTWALRGTANVATRSRLVSAYTANLNHHVEHHLFPSVESRHLPAIARVVRSVCADHDIEYLEFTSYRQAIGAWLAYLRQMGRAPAAASRS